MKEIDIYIGRRIREAREDLGWNQKQLGELMSYTPMAISHFEKGTRQVRATNLYAFAKVLQKPLNYFVPNSTLSEPLAPPIQTIKSP